MAEPFVLFVVKSLGALLIQEAQFLHGVRDKVQDLQTELNRMQHFLKDADSRRAAGDELVRSWVAEIREAVYSAEDAIETFVVKVAFRGRGGFLNLLMRYSISGVNNSIARHKVAVEIRSIKTKISSITTSLQAYGVRATTSREGETSSTTSQYERQRLLRQSYPQIMEEDVVVLGEDLEKISGHLVNESHRVVSIWGMGGLGKTTLAKKVYNHHKVRRHFDCFAWVYISQQCNTREVFEEILIQILSPSHEERQTIKIMKHGELVQKLYQVQCKKKCLVVLDDIWETHHWDNLRPAFPNEYVGSKILLTSRNREVVDLQQGVVVHELRRLTEAESWDLFEKKACLRRNITELPIEMKTEGKEMMKHCGGVPLAIVVLGGLLATKHTLKEWEMVRRNISRELGKGKGPEGVPVDEILALSYLDLPYHLKPCFLYFSNLPEDHDIRADTLVQTWAAEGIIVGEIREGETMMDVGMSYLGELVQRCMVQVQLTRYSKRIKLCRLHDLMRDMCLLKAKEENFVEVVLMGAADSASSSSSTSTITTTRVRRLALHYLGIESISSNYDRLGTMNHHHIRSCQFYLFGEKLKKEEWQRIKSLLKGFKLLRVLYLERLDISNRLKMLRREIGNLIHLSYLGLTIDWGIQRLPSSIGNLALLETLDLRLSEIRKLPNFLWKLKQLRHLYLPRPIWRRPRRKKLRLGGLSKLETLVNFDGRQFDVGCFSKLMNLRKLRVSWVDLNDLAVILESPSISKSDSLLRNSSICTGKDFETQEGKRLLREVSGCHHLHKLLLNGTLNTLPDLFPPNLTSLSLLFSALKEDPMRTLEKLPNLRILRLMCDSYIGKKMVCSAPSSTTPSSSSRGGDYGREEKEGGFRQLKYLCLDKLGNLEEWTIEDGAMPSLLRLDIILCHELKEIPGGLRFVSTLQELKIEVASQAFTNKLREGGEDFYKVRHVPSIKFFQPGSL